MSLLDMELSDYNAEEAFNARYEAALESLINYHQLQNGWDSITELVEEGKISLRDLVMDVLKNGDF